MTRSSRRRHLSAALKALAMFERAQTILGGSTANGDACHQHPNIHRTEMLLAAATGELRRAVGNLVKSGFIDLLNSGPKEIAIQRYLELHPELLYGYPPSASLVVPQFPLGSEWVVDFAFLAPFGSAPRLWLVEIERPSLRIFTKADEFSQPFNHALQQLLDWSNWCEHNRAYLSTPFRNYGDVF